MTELKRALYTFWSQFGVPAYLSDCVPDDAQLPYITYSVSMSSFSGQTVQTAYAWCERDPDGNVWRTSLMDDIRTAFPVGGLMVSVGDGYIIMYRNDSDFLKDWQDPNDTDVLGARVSYIIQHNYL